MKEKKIGVESIIIVFYIMSAIIANDGSFAIKFARVALFAAMLLRLLKQKHIKWNQYFSWLAIFLVVSAMSVSWAESKTIAIAMIKTMTINAICMAALLYLINFSEKRLELSIKALAISPAFLEIHIILNGGLLAGFGNVREVGGLSLNTVGLCGGFGACCALYSWMRNKNKILWLAILGVDVLVVILSASRKALFCFIIPIMITYIFDKNGSVVKKLIRIAILTIVIVSGYLLLLKVPFLYNSIGNRVESMFAAFAGNTSEADGSTLDRINLTAWGIKWFKEKPIIGHGIDNYRVVLHGFRSDYPMSYYAHNNYVELLVDVGIVGLVAYYWNYIYMLISVIRYRRIVTNEEFIIIGMLIALVINEVGLVSYYAKYIQVLLLIIWIIIYRIRLRYITNTAFRNMQGEIK